MHQVVCLSGAAPTADHRAGLRIMAAVITVDHAGLRRVATGQVQQERE